MSFTVIDAGLHTTVQDLGRPGLGHLGVSTSGAFDRIASRNANTLVGNEGSCAVLEVVRGGLSIKVHQDHVVAVTGAAGSLSIDGRAANPGRPIHLSEGSTLTLGIAQHGLRAYLGVAGGIDAPAILGSRSTDTLAGIGDVVRSGETFGVGEPAGQPASKDSTWTPRLHDVSVEVVPGPRDDWFTADALATLFATAWTVTDRCDRIGVRLHGPELTRRITHELPSEPCMRGSIQVTSAGHPVILGPDYPVTGDYPVIGVVRDADTDQLAQVGPSDLVRFSRSRST